MADTRNTENAGAGFARRVFFTPDQSSKISLRILAAGIDDPEPLAVAASNHGAVQGGAVLMDVDEGKRYFVDLNFTQPYSGPIELVATKVGNA